MPEFDPMDDIQDTSYETLQLLDTRYAGEIVTWYANHMAMEFGGVSGDYDKQAEAFLTKYRDYHENNRWNFQPHPNWRKELLGESQVESFD